MGLQDLSLHMLDIVQNSIRAGASLIEIGFTLHTDSHLLTFSVKDDGCGMSKESRDRVMDPFYTTRTTRKVGLGLPFLRMSAELTGGSFSLESQKGIGTTVTATFDTSHIDCLPLGKIGESYAALIPGNPSTEIVLTFTVDEISFTADTRDFKQILEGVPLDSPQIITFIKGYVEEHINQLIMDNKG